VALAQVDFAYQEIKVGQKLALLIYKRNLKLVQVSSVCLLSQRLQSGNWFKNNFANFQTKSDVQNSLCTDTTTTARKHFG